MASVEGVSAPAAIDKGSACALTTAPAQVGDRSIVRAEYSFVEAAALPQLIDVLGRKSHAGQRSIVAACKRPIGSPHQGIRPLELRNIEPEGRRFDSMVSCHVITSRTGGGVEVPTRC
ncbi:hypothetical protein [Xanthomonas fragariae]|uniref:hypothetical protein n=1 Tax=Xanthomonas fragariae TaxID=48664 RepID=UPI001ABE25C1|nr:hypothetical protein [Xanthomonas fragariae]UKR54307.1 hypothetical protein K4A87_19695 [Xanthomonas fragariae]